MKKKRDKIKKVKIEPGALAKAAGDGKLSLVKLLMDSGANPNEKNRWHSETPLMKAAYNGKFRVVKYLLDNGADIKERDSRGNTALLHAAWTGHLKVVKELLRRGADINEKNGRNWNALMQASGEGHYPMVRYLLEKGSPTDEVDREKGATALTLAIHSGSQKLIGLLKSYGAEERRIRLRKKGAKYYPILECEICEYIPHKKELARSEYLENIRGLEKVHSLYTEPDSYTEDVELIMKCSLCGTYYDHYHSVDTEDAFVGGPSICQNIQRFNLLRLKQVLAETGEKKELSQLERRYPGLIESFVDTIKKNPEKLNDNFRSYFIESVTDYFILHDNWKRLKSVLLDHPDPEIAFDSLRDLTLIYGETYRGDGFPSFTYYRDFTREIKEKGITMLEIHNSEYKESLVRFKGSRDKNIRKRYRDVMESAKYYKVLRKPERKKLKN
jgi:hypothetical protein